jgi:dipeptidyl aminopeptidase/acylaminoacyl peptidase
VGGIVRVATPLVVALVLVGLVGVPASASADQILYERITYPQGVRWWLISPDGSHARRLPVIRVAQHPDLTLDGRRLVFEQLLGGGGLMTSPLARPRVRSVWRPPSLPLFPRWSPSGKRIAAIREVKPASNWPENVRFLQVFVIRPGGGQARRLRTPVSMTGPSWSPDGRRIVAGGYDETTFSSGLWVINVATGAAREIVHFDNELSGAPAWSPNGRTIAFNRGSQGTEDAHIWTVRPNGTGLRQLTRQPVSNSSPPSWSPDGHRLAITIQRRGRQRDIATIRADGSGLRVLTRSGDNWYPDWSR